MKICNKCKTERDESDFNWRVKDLKRHTICKKCHLLLSKEYYYTNAEDQRQKQSIRRANRANENSRRLYDYYKSNPCVDCGEANPVKLQLDHINRSEKFSEIATMIADYKWSIIQVEIDKCQVRCASCHQFKTAKESNYRLYQLWCSENKT